MQHYYIVEKNTAFTEEDLSCGNYDKEKFIDMAMTHEGFSKVVGENKKDLEVSLVKNIEVEGLCTFS